jgi:hypothetical protein
VKIINGIRERHEDLVEEFNKGKLTKAERKELKKLGIRLHDVEAIRAYREEKAKAAAEAAEAERLAAEEKARIEREQNPTAEELLKKILEVISK